ncbi:MAG: aldo/keto reductase [Actinomycetota bacterium]|nr:aldo/keto reductase [Actinomycetota bacterium]
MRYRRFEPLGRELSVLALGTAYLADDGEAASFELLDAWVELGGNLVDCARQYGDGESERILGRWLESRAARDGVVLVTKGAHHATDGSHHEPSRKRVAPEHIAADLAESLEALRTDAIDLYFLHRDDLSRPVGPIVEALNEHAAAGRIETLGASNWTTDRIEEANAYAASRGLRGFEASSPGLSLAEPRGEPWPETVFARSAEARAWYRRAQLAVFAWSSQAGGFFAGRRDALVKRVYVDDRNLERLRRAEELGRRKGFSANEVALAWVLHQPFPTYAIIGPRSVPELHESVAGLDVELTVDEVRWLNLDEEDV